jgi:hypothetical protein
MSEHTPIVCYKIVDASPAGEYKTLFHAVNGSRILPVGQWIEANRKWAGEGGNKYWTGFHVLLSKEKAKKYFKKFTDEKKTRIIIKGTAMNLRPKKSSRGLVFLADKLLINRKQTV